MTFFTRSRPKTGRSRFRPSLEALEDRFCPAAPTLSLSANLLNSNWVELSGQVSDENPEALNVVFSGLYQGATTTNADGTFSAVVALNSLGTIEATVTDGEDLTSEPVQVTLSSAVPTISNFQITRDGETTFTLSGMVADDSPSNLYISFSGLSALQGQTTVVGVDGSFIFTVEIPVGEAGLIYAQTTDWFGQVSNQAEVQVDNSASSSNQAPSLTYTVTNLYENWIEIAGQVTDEDPAGLTVSFTGIYEGSVDTNADGSFSLVVQASGLGTITAVVSDWETLSSDPVVVTFTTAKPVISDFCAVRNYDNVWTFSGHVEDESPLGLEVYFGGLNSLSGKSACVDGDGDFCLTLALAENETGLAWAKTTDWWNEQSEEATWAL